MPVESKSPRIALAKRSVYLLTGIFLICFLFFVIISWYVVVNGHTAVDNAVIILLNPYRLPWIVRAMHWITFYGSSTFLIPANLILVFFLARKRSYSLALMAAFTALGGSLMQSTLKLLFARPRPHLPLIPDILTFSYPSGHSFSSAVFFGLLAFWFYRSTGRPRYRRSLAASVLLLPLLIGLSRVILNVHYATDVIAGFSLAVIWLILCYAIWRWWTSRALGKKF